jgi:hypothetical protein
MFDEGVDGDLATLIECLRHAKDAVHAITWVSLGAIVLWAILTWFLAGGLIAVLVEVPHGRRDTARTFGAAGAHHFFVMARLGLISLFGHVIVLIAAVIGLDVVYPRIEHALTLGQVLGALALGLSPALLLLAALWTVIDHARVDLVLQRNTHEGFGATHAFIRACVLLVKRPVAIAQVLLWGAAFVAITVLYAWAAQGHAMLGASGAIALAIIREGVALVRMALKVALIGGQVELGRTRPPPAGAR